MLPGMNLKTVLILLTIIIYQIQLSSQELSSKSAPDQKPPKNIILMIGDGMGINQVYSTIVANGKLNLEEFKYIGFHKTTSADNYVTDSGAGGTALATGSKTYNGAIAVDINGKSLKTILEIAEEKGKHTGLVATSSITHATPASFIAHNPSRANYQEIAEDFLKTDIEVFIGGGKKDFNQRKDGLDLVKELLDKGYQITDTITDLANIKSGKLAGFTAKGHNPSILDGRGDMLGIATKKGIELLNQSPKGFFLMIEGSQIDWAGHDNDPKGIIAEMIDFDKAVGIALEFAKKDGNTLLIITADHETGGIAINKGDLKTGELEYGFTTKNHTGGLVPVFAYGPGAHNFMGIYENTDVFYKMLTFLEPEKTNKAKEKKSKKSKKKETTK